MDFALTEEQRMLKKVAQDWLSNRCSKTFVREMESDERGHSPQLWREMADNGWLGLVVPEQYGGMGMTFLDLAVLLEEMGRAMLPGPFFSTIVAALAILETGNEQQKEELLGQIASGDLVATLALTEPSGRWDARSITLTASPEGDDFVLDGTKRYVPDANVADLLITAAKTEQGVSLFAVKKEAPGLGVTVLKTMAGDKLCDVVFDKVRVPAASMLGEPSQTTEALQSVLEKAAVAKCAESVGGAQEVLEMTVAYAKQRIQFKRPISNLQVIQHYCAEMATNVDACRFITYQAAWKMADGLPASKDAAVAKAWTSEAYRKITVLGQQIHGAVGFSLEHDMQLYYRRAKTAEVMYGGPELHREKLAAQIGL